MSTGLKALTAVAAVGTNRKPPNGGGRRRMMLVVAQHIERLMLDPASASQLSSLPFVLCIQGLSLKTFKESCIKMNDIFIENGKKSKNGSVGVDF